MSTKAFKITLAKAQVVDDTTFKYMLPIVKDAKLDKFL